VSIIRAISAVARVVAAAILMLPVCVVYGMAEGFVVWRHGIKPVCKRRDAGGQAVSNLLSDAALAEITEAVTRKLTARGHMTKRLYQVHEAAEYMGCSPQQVRNWIAGGKLQNVSLDARSRVDLTDMARLIEEGKSA